jgi:competence protein ComEC
VISKYKFHIILLVFLATVIILGCTKGNILGTRLNRNPDFSEDMLLVHYIDVGQGDAILIQVNNKNLLIDAGPSAASEKLLKYLKKSGVRRIDYLLATHPHEDHIGGIPAVLRKYKTKHFYAPKVTSSTKAFENMVSSLRSKNLKINIAKSGVELNMGKNITCEIISPIKSNYEELNHYSAVLLLSYGSKKFLFMGDAEKQNEIELARSNYDLQADVLKIGHHGSSSSTTIEFLELISPVYCIISCGRRNDYGHPHKEVLSTLQNQNITVYRTDYDKDIVLICDGSKIIRYK